MHLNLKDNGKAYGTHHLQHISRSRTVTFTRRHSSKWDHWSSKNNFSGLKKVLVNILIFLPSSNSSNTTFVNSHQQGRMQKSMQSWKKCLLKITLWHYKISLKYYSFRDDTLAFQAEESTGFCLFALKCGKKMRFCTHTHNVLMFLPLPPIQ